MQPQQPNVPQSSPQPDAPQLRSMTQEESRHELKQAIQGSNQVLVSATTALSLFPDTLTLDRAMLSVTHRTFVQSAEVMSMRIEDILNVTATLGPFLGSVKITSRVLTSEEAYTVGSFWRQDALKIMHITQGYIIALRQRIDCSALSTEELKVLLQKLGQENHGH